MEIIKAMKNDIYSVDIKNILVCFLSFKVLLVEIKQLRAVGMPVVVNAHKKVKYYMVYSQTLFSYYIW